MQYVCNSNKNKHFVLGVVILWQQFPTYLATYTDRIVVKAQSIFRSYLPSLLRRKRAKKTKSFNFFLYKCHSWGFPSKLIVVEMWSTADDMRRRDVMRWNIRTVSASVALFKSVFSHTDHLVFDVLHYRLCRCSALLTM